MPASSYRYAPLFIALVAGGIALGLARAWWEESRAAKTWRMTQGRVLETKKRSEPIGEGGDGSYLDYYLVRCTYHTSDGWELIGWADRRYNRPVGYDGTVVPLWYDPLDPETFTVQPPQSFFRAGLKLFPVIVIVSAFGAFALFLFSKGF